MGIWEFIYSNTPDLTPVKNACRTSYNYGSIAVSKTLTPVKYACGISYYYGSAAVSKIGEVAGVNDGLQKVKGYIPDEKSRAQINNFAAKFAQNAANYALNEGYKEAYKLVPGGKQMGKIVSKTIQDMKSENQNMIMEEANVESGKSPSRSVDDVLEPVGTKIKAVEYFDHQKGISTANQTPEDVLRIFMMKEFIGTRFLDDLIIPQKRHASMIPPKVKTSS